MFNYPELVRLSIILCVSALIFGVSLRYKKVAFAKYSFYFGLVALFEYLSISSLYFDNELFNLVKYIIFILLLYFSPSKETLKQLDISQRFYFSTIIAAFCSYIFFKFLFFPSFAFQFKVLNSIVFLYFLLLSRYFLIPILLVIIYIEKNRYKGKFTETFSFMNIILTPLTVAFVCGALGINGIMSYAGFGELQQPKTINGVKLDIGSNYHTDKRNLNLYLEIKAKSGKFIQWHDMPVKNLSRARILEDHYIIQVYDYLEVYTENDQLIHNRLCDKTEPLKFRFLSDNYDDWSEQNTEFVSCKLVADTPLNQMRILNNLGDEITLTYKPLQNNNTHPKKLYQDFNLFPYIKWHWEVNKAINLFPNIKSEITDLYLDDNRNLMALLIENEIENDNAENVILDNQCTLSRSEFRKMLILNVGSNPVTASFPKLSNEQKCTPQQLELYIDKKAIFDD